jgi:hypothetical protein
MLYYIHFVSVASFAALGPPAARGPLTIDFTLPLLPNWRLNLATLDSFLSSSKVALLVDVVIEGDEDLTETFSSDASSGVSYALEDVLTGLFILDGSSSFLMGSVLNILLPMGVTELSSSSSSSPRATFVSILGGV